MFLLNPCGGVGVFFFFETPEIHRGQNEKKALDTSYKQETTSIPLINERGSVHPVGIREHLTSHAGLAPLSISLLTAQRHNQLFLLLIWCHQSKWVFHCCKGSVNVTWNQKSQCLTWHLLCASLIGQFDRNKAKESPLTSLPSSLIIQMAKQEILLWLYNDTGFGSL